MSDLISVVIPIYNVEAYLQRCIESVVHQTYENIEIILVDDGSPDKCGEICDKYEAGDSRIRVIHQENKGLSGARNVAIDLSTGKYITFLDSDDWLELNAIEIMYQLSLKYQAGIVGTSLLNVYDNGETKNNTSIKSIKEYDTKDALSSFLFNGHLTPCVCGKLYLKELWNDIRCPEGKIFEDQFTTYKLIDRASKIVFYPTALYNYYKRGNSIGHSSFSKKNYHLYEGINEEYSFITTKYPETISDMNVAKITWEMVFVNMMIRGNAVDKNIVNTCRQFSRKNLKDVYCSEYIDKIRKIQITLFSFSLPIYKIMYKKYLRKNPLN